MKSTFSFFALILCCCPFISIAQGKEEKAGDKMLRIEANRKTETPFSILFKEDAGYTAADIPQIFAENLKARAGLDELRFINATENGNITVNKYQQFFKNIKVEHGSATLSLNKGKLASMLSDFYTLSPQTNISPALSEANALNKAMAEINASIYKWQLTGEEEHLKRETGKPEATYFPKGELVLVEDFRAGGELNGKVMLAYKFDIYAHAPVSRNNVYVDAVTGNVLFTDAVIKHITEPIRKNKQPNLSPLLTGTATTRYSGVVSLPTILVGTYRLQSALATEGYPLHTMNMLKGMAYASAVEFTDANNVWTAAEFDNANFDNIALDAHWGAAKVFDYWKIKHNRNSYNNANAVINSYVHFDVAYDNAYWDGIRMTYGDGSNVAGGFSPLTSLDVCAHEIGHAVCQFTANLAYNRESGAMNEGFSDIWGAAAEQYADPLETDALPKSNFLIGEEISIGSGALRSMSDPKAFFQPDTYLGTYWQDASPGGCVTPSNANDQCGVHTNSGVLNYWFYLLVTGKTGTNDFGTAYSVPGIGWTDAERIAYLTETTLTASSNYAACRTASINAATTLFGACSIQTEAVTRAWFAVNVGADYIPCTPQIMFNGIAQTITETGTTGATCLKTKTITVPLKITSAASQNATVSFTISGTAANGNNLDYSISPATVSFPAGFAVNQNLTLVINNDGYVEGTETVLLTINTVTTTGNASKGNVYQQYSINITDDDYPPATASFLASQVIYSENFTAAGAWVVANSTGATSTWKIGANAGTSPHFGAANNCAYVSLNTTTFTYGTVAGASRIQSPSISTINKSNLQLTFDIICNGEISAGTYYDYGKLYYSIDNGANFIPINATFYQGIIAKTTITVPLPAGAENAANLKLGFRWDNDNSVQNQPPFGIDNIVLRGDTRSAAVVQTGVNTGASSDQEYLGPNATVHFYDNVSGNIMATIANLSAFDYGCTTVEVDRSGTASQFISGDVSGNLKQKLTDKSFKVTPAINSASGDYRITLYFTAAEKTGYETSSTRAWIADNGSNNGTKIAKHSTSISSMSTATAITPAMVESVGTYGTEHTITARFTNGFSGFAVGVPPLTLVPVTLVDFIAVKNANAVELKWKVAQQVNIKNYEVEHATDGIYFTRIGNKLANNLTNSDYSLIHLQPVTGSNFYRLKILDADGSFYYSDVAEIEYKTASMLSVIPNPVEDDFTVSYTGSKKMRTVQIMDATGKLVKAVNIINNRILQINAQDLLPGVYILRMQDEDNRILSARFIKL